MPRGERFHDRRERAHRGSRGQPEHMPPSTTAADAFQPQRPPGANAAVAPPPPDRRRRQRTHQQRKTPLAMPMVGVTARARRQPRRVTDHDTPTERTSRTPAPAAANRRARPNGRTDHRGQAGESRRLSRQPGTRGLDGAHEPARQRAPPAPPPRPSSTPSPVHSDPAHTPPRSCDHQPVTTNPHRDSPTETPRSTSSSAATVNQERHRPPSGRRQTNAARDTSPDARRTWSH